MSDPYSEGINEIGAVPPHYLREVEHFFKVYKDLEGTRTESRGFEGAAAARQVIEQAMGAYDQRFGGSR
jgi:inorganic pyrophosphatase